jgi:hypothetical protein
LIAASCGILFDIFYGAVGLNSVVICRSTHRGSTRRISRHSAQQRDSSGQSARLFIRGNVDTLDSAADADDAADRRGFPLVFAGAGERRGITRWAFIFSPAI